MPGIPSPAVRKLRLLLKDFPVSVRNTNSRSVLNPYLEISRTDGCTFGSDMSGRINDLLRPEFARSRPDPDWYMFFAHLTDFRRNE